MRCIGNRNIIMNIQDLLNLRTDAHQKDLFVPVVMAKSYSLEDEIVQFTDTAFFELSSGNVTYLVKFGVNLANHRYGLVVNGYEPDSDGGFNFTYLYEISSFGTTEEFLEGKELVLGVTHEVVKIINDYVARKNR